MNFGTDIGYSAFHQTNKFNNSSLYKKICELVSAVQMFLTSLKRKEEYLFMYNGYTQQPDINQIQPVLTNTDPLNITIGNPSLKPAFRK